MKIVNIIGGLGNQMFQYAFAISLKKKHPNEDVYIDTQHYKNAFIKVYKGNNYYHNGFEIYKVFPNASLTIAKVRDIIKLSLYIPNQVLARAIRRILPNRKSEFIANHLAYTYLPEAQNIEDDCYYDGYWMSHFFFENCRDEIIKEFTFRPFDTDQNIQLQRLLNNNNSITIHIRRGDYVGSASFGGICTLNYYRNAIEEAKKIIESPTFFIFSNDTKWCEENLKDEFGNANVYFVTHNKASESYRDMQLMSMARCNILANSSFSWWGAYLNQRTDHIVYCPSKWHNTIEHQDIYPHQWNKINLE